MNVIHKVIKSCAIGVGLWIASLSAVQAAAPQPTTLLITHPRASVLKHYVTMVRQHVLDVPNLRIVGIYHESETEDYRDAAAYLQAESIDWIRIEPVHCALDANDVFRDNACRPTFQKLIKESHGIVFNGGP
ncbi:MAG TPA: hypothetical protein VFH51_06195, partial [Myxococcota bacterium]|nr:hypothetical protein [Myxococcota bacterium]